MGADSPQAESGPLWWSTISSSRQSPIAVSSMPGIRGRSEWGKFSRSTGRFKRLRPSHSRSVCLDYDGLVARYGRAHWHDERKWLTVRLPIAAQNLNHLVNEWLRFLCPLTGKLAKVLVVDLDNTLWGGVIGEDGVAGIRRAMNIQERHFRITKSVAGPSSSWHPARHLQQEQP